MKCVLQDYYVKSNVTQTHMFQNRKKYEETKQKNESNTSWNLVRANKN